MEGRLSLSLRMIADGVMILGFGGVAPAALSSINQSWSTLLTAFVLFLFAMGFWYDFMRTLQRFRKLRAN